MKQLIIEHLNFFINRMRSRLGSGLFLSLLAGVLHVGTLSAQQKNPSRIMLQGFWWGSWHDSYPNGYYDYLTRLAPKLRELGVDAIWVFPPQKAGQQEVKMQNPVGFTYPKFYESFDNYDLGDKYQKGTTATRGGTKDEYLRMVAVMHANGIDVIQDVILNHNAIGGPFMLTPLDGAIDPQAPLIDPNQPQQELDYQKSKNYRYVSYSTPVVDESSSDYLNRRGRWPKNYQNFHPVNGGVHPCPAPGQPQGADVCNSIFGFNIHDYCIYSNAIGQSSNAIYNPVQPNNYMYTEMAKWLVWFKKQSGFDGVRLDAVKHIETGLVLGLMDELQNNAGWASGGPGMFAVGELIDNKANMDNWVAVQEQQRCGTFDFSLRNEIREMIIQNGFYSMSNLPGAQQNERARTVPVVNNHDSFRPVIDPNTGIYSNFASGSPFLAPINPNSPRLPGAYAVACAVDGTPDIFIEDLFNLNTGNRYTHDPQVPGQLIVRDKIANIIWAHQVMDWKDFDYKVRTAAIENPIFTKLNANDVLVIERQGRALITVNDNGDPLNGEGEVEVVCGFPDGTVLHDYSGHYPDVVVGANLSGRVKLKVPPVDSASNKHGYGIWSTTNFINMQHNPPQRSTTQEWEMADDLGDSHPLSLQQGGELPLFGIVFETRKVGRIYAEAGKNIHLELYPSIQGKLASSIMLRITDASGASVHVTGKNALTLDHVPGQTGYCLIEIANQQPNSPRQKVFVKATYTAPKIVDPLQDSDSISGSSFKEQGPNNELEGISISVFPNPSTGDDIVFRYTLSGEKAIRLSVFDLEGRLVGVLEEGRLPEGTHQKVLRTSELTQRSYIYRLESGDRSTSGRFEIIR